MPGVEPGLQSKAMAKGYMALMNPGRRTRSLYTWGGDYDQRPDPVNETPVFTGSLRECHDWLDNQP